MSWCTRCDVLMSKKIEPQRNRDRNSMRTVKDQPYFGRFNYKYINGILSNDTRRRDIVFNSTEKKKGRLNWTEMRTHLIREMHSLFWKLKHVENERNIIKKKSVTEYLLQEHILSSSFLLQCQIHLTPPARLTPFRLRQSASHPQRESNGKWKKGAKKEKNWIMCAMHFYWFVCLSVCK